MWPDLIWKFLLASTLERSGLLISSMNLQEGSELSNCFILLYLGASSHSFLHNSFLSICCFCNFADLLAFSYLFSILVSMSALDELPSTTLFACWSTSSLHQYFRK